MISYENTVDQLEASGVDTAIVPIGSLEQHSHHLPLHTDNFIAEAYAKALGERLPAYVLPALPISTCREHMGKKGSVWMRPETFYQMIQDICLSLKEQGFRKVVLLQAHGGIFILPPAVRQLNALYNPDLLVCKVEYAAAAGKMAAEGIAQSPELHAGEGETSLMLHLRPDLVRMDLAVDFVPDVPREYLNYASIFRYSPHGVWGYPSKGSPETGKRMVELFAEAAEAYVKEVFGMMEDKGTFGYSRF